VKDGSDDEDRNCVCGFGSVALVDGNRSLVREWNRAGEEDEQDGESQERQREGAAEVDFDVWPRGQSMHLRSGLEARARTCGSACKLSQPALPYVKVWKASIGAWNRGQTARAAVCCENVVIERIDMKLAILAPIWVELRISQPVTSGRPQLLPSTC